MTKKLFFQALIKFLLGIVLVGMMIFLPAGTVSFFYGWLFMGVLFIPMFFVGVVLMCKNPALLKSRLDAKEESKEQDLVVKLSGLMFLIGFVVATVGFRLGWYVLPKGVSIGAAVVFLISYLLYFEVLRENTYLSRTVKVQNGQTVVDSGMYAVVRHPMYSITLVMFLSMPVVLGSVYSFLIFLVYPFIIAKRIKNEEELLENELEGYSEYKKKVKYRLIPFIW